MLSAHQLLAFFVPKRKRSRISRRGKVLLKRARRRFRRRYQTARITLLRFHTAGVALMVAAFVAGSYFTVSEYLLPRVRALTETTHSFSSDTAFTASGYDDDSGAVTVESSSVTLAKATNWWDVTYKYNKQLTIKNLSGSDLSATATMQYTVNTKELYDAGQLQADCDDLRIVYYTGSGDHTELTRSYSVPGGFTNCSDSTATLVAFPLQASLANSASSTDYYLYYGNSDATNPGYGDNGYSIGSAEATLVCPFNGTTTCVDGETPSTETGAIRYSGGKGALSFDGNNDRVEVPRAAISSALSTVLTFETWFKTPDKTKNGYIFGGTNFGYDFHSLSYVYGHSASQYFTFTVRTGAGTTGVNVSTNTGGTINNNQWYHVAGTYDGSTVKIYLDGVLSGQAVLTGNSSTGGPPSLGIGANYCGTTNYPNCTNYLAGFIDEVRISDSVRYTTNFTPQTTPFEPDANTKLLLHFDENGDDPRNTGKAIDSSGNGNHGTITGAKYVGGLVGADSSSTDTGAIPVSTYGAHNGIFIEEGTTNKITNPSFENSTAYNTSWGTNYFNYDSTTDTFTASMAKRNSAGPFAAGVMVQGDTDGSGTPDSIGSGSLSAIANPFYDKFDGGQGSIAFWVTPEWNGNDGYEHRFWMDSNSWWYISKSTAGVLTFRYQDGSYITVSGPDISGWVSGNTYSVIISWDSRNTLDGTNYVRFSVNDVHTFARTTKFYAPQIAANGYSVMGSNALIEGLTIYRRPLFDGTYGLDVGNGDEINQIYNSGTGKDPTLITGSWDVVFALPTNASTGALTTGTGNAWSHPHASNLLYTSTTNTGGFMMNGTYTTDGFADTGTPTSVGALATGEKIFSGGYKYTSDATNEGIYRTFTATNGGDYVLRALGHSDGTCDPQVKITRADGTTEISHLNGTTSSTRTGPDVYIFTWESPAAESEQVQLINTASSGTCYWHQVEVLSNLIDNPSMEAGSGDPWKPTGWTNYALEAGDIEQELSDIHSGSSSLQFNTGANTNEAIYESSGNNIVANTYYGSGLSAKVVSGNFRFKPIRSWGAPQANSATSFPTGSDYIDIASASWDDFFSVARGGTTIGSAVGELMSNSASGLEAYTDDIYFFSLSNVSLTVTPASEANSTESSGLRVDGADTLTQPITGLSADRGVIKFKFTPRHNFDVADNFGNSSPTLITLWGNSNNFIRLYRLSDSYFRLLGTFNNTTVVVNGGSTLNAGTTYDIEIGYTSGGSLYWSIDGTQVTSNTGVVDFNTIPTTAYFGAYYNGTDQYDGTISNFTALTPTENTTSPYYKFGSKSAKLVNAGSYADEYTIAIDPDSTSYHHLSAYVYDGTSGNVGGAVDSTVAKLVFGGNAVATTYTDMGGGWWRLSKGDYTIDNSLLYGIQALAGKTIYIDGVQLEAEWNTTSYCDGSLGTGYSWGGTAHESASSRTVESLKYASSNNLSASSGTVSLWVKPNMSSSYRKFFFGLNGEGVANSIVLNDYGNGLINMTVIDNTGYPSGLRNAALSSSGRILIGKWTHIVGTWGAGSVNLYVNGSDSGVTLSGSGTGALSSLLSTFNVGAAYNGGNESDSVISDFKIFNSVLSDDEVADLYYTGLQSHSSGSEVDDRYQATGTYTSPVIDLSANGAWGSTPWTATQTLNSGTIGYSTRTSSDNATWSDWAAVSGNSIASTALRYLQWKADLAPAASPVGGAPILSGVDIAYVEDSTVPTNPTNTALGFSTAATGSADLTSATWYNYTTPKFTWEAGSDPAANGQSASGVASYQVLLTTDNTAVPSENTGDSCYALVTAGSESYTVGTSNANCVLANGTYYLRLQTKDNSGNVATAVTLFTYKFDATAPNAPASVSATTIGYSATNSFTFFWPTAVDNGPSGVAGYEYKTGADGADWTFTTSAQVADVAAYQEGQNVFYVRTKDTAGNYSTVTSSTGTVSFYYNSTAPTAPQNLAISPSTTSESPAATNSFTVTWDEPASYSGTLAKYHYCVNCTPAESTMTEATGAETVARSITSAALATQQGRNTFYIVAEDNNVNTETGHGNRNFDAYTSIDFYASTVAPEKPTNVTITDASDRDNSKWRLSLAWDPGDEDNLPDHYLVYRSTDNTTFSRVGNVSGTAYTDGSLTQSQVYYYKILAVDNAGASSLYSATVTKTPEGRYNSPPSAGGTPSVSAGSTTAIVRWTTGRNAFGSVEHGKTASYGASSAESLAGKDHSVKLTGLAPGTTYHYRVQSLDDSDLVGYERAQAYSADYTFTTLSTADISGITVTDQGLDSVVISWATTSLASSKVEYGETTEYGLQVEVSTAADQSTHTARLSNLKHSTSYHFRVSGTTADADDIFSQDATFATLTFPKITAVVFSTDQSQGGTAVTLAWSSNVPTTAIAEYQAVQIDVAAAANVQKLKDQGLIVQTTEGQQVDLAVLQSLDRADLASIPVLADGEKQTVYDGALSPRHVQRLQSLDDGALYIFTLRGVDKYGNEVVSEPIRYVTGIDTKPPSIRELAIETPLSGAGSESEAKIIVSFTTDEPAKSKLEWGTGTGTEYGQSTEFSSGFGTQHALILRNLSPTTSYHLRIISEDEVGNQTTSEDMVVVTPTVQEAAFDVIIKNLSDVFGFLKF